MKVKSVQMGILSGAGSTSCGSYDGVKVELKAKPDQCITEPYGSFSAGDTLDWKEELLGNCKTALFDPMEETISLLIKTDRDDGFCPISVKIILNDHTSYLLTLDGSWHNSVQPYYTNNITYTADKLPGKICTLLLIIHTYKIKSGCAHALAMPLMVFYILGDHSSITSSSF